MKRVRIKPPAHRVYPPWLVVHQWSGGHYFLECTPCGRDGGIAKHSRRIMARFAWKHRHCGTRGAADPRKAVLEREGRQ